MNLIILGMNRSKVFCEKDLFIVLTPSKCLDLPTVLILGRTHTDFTPLLTPVLSSSHGPTAYYVLPTTYYFKTLFLIAVLLVPNISQCQPFAQFSEHTYIVATCETLARNKEKTKNIGKDRNWMKGRCPGAKPFATLSGTSSSVQPMHYQQQHQSCSGGRKLRPAHIDSPATTEDLASLLFFFLLSKYGRRDGLTVCSSAHVEAAAVQPQTAKSLDVALQR